MSLETSETQEMVCRVVTSMTYTDGAPDDDGGAGGITINELPNELLLHILAQLDWEGALAAARVCLRWQRLALAPFLWENMRMVICMKNYTSVDHHIVPHISKYLKHVKLQYFKLYSQIREPLLLYCPNLTHLEISISQVDKVIFEDLRRWPRLKYLSFRNSLIGGETAPRYHLPFETLPELQTLILSNFALTADSLEAMLSCRHLVSLNMEKMKNVPSEFFKRLVALRRETLEALHVYGDTLDDEFVASLAHCRRLRVLHIMTCKTLFDSSLRRLAALSCLRSLKLRHGYFSSVALLACFAERRFPHLTYLSLSRCLHVDMQVAQAIKMSAPNLAELSFYLCPFIMSPHFDRSELEKLFSIQLLLD